MIVFVYGYDRKDLLADTPMQETIYCDIADPC